MLKTRIISVIMSLPLIIIPLYFGEKLVIILVLLLSIAGLYEYYNAFKNIHYKPVTYIGYIGAIVYYIIIVLNYKPVILHTLLLFVLLLLMFFDALLFEKSVLDISITILSLIYIPFQFSYILFLQDGIYGKLLIWLPFLTAWLSDTFAYFFGVYFGKRKLCPKISPKKTIEGALGGILGSTIFSLLAGILFKGFGLPYSLLHFLIIGVLSGITSQTGDLFASSIKRFCKIKDFSNILPGHGGILDRFDSILFTAPIVYFYFRLFL